MENRTTAPFCFVGMLCFFFVILLTGCAARFHVDVNSISSPDAELKKRYLLLPGLKDVEVTDLQFKEFSQYVERALVSRGFIKANGFEDANVVIFVVYGIGNPQEHINSYSLPILGQTGVSSSSTFGTINTFRSTATYSGTTTYTPTYGITGYIPITRSYVTYFRFLMLDAIDLDEYRKSQKLVQLWATTVTSTGSSGDLRLVFPVLVGASKPYIGTNTGNIIQIRLTENDQSVVEIK